MGCYLKIKINKDKIRLIIKMPDYSKSKIYLIKNKNINTCITAIQVYKQSY